MKYVISGYGKMGHMVEEALKRRGLEVALCSEDIKAVPTELARESVCIDFTTPAAFRENYPFIAANFKAAVVGTTGWNDISDAVFAAFKEAGSVLVWASNFSIGVNAWFAAIERVCKVLKGQGYEPSVEEIHHIHKLDAPSGTAKSAAGIISAALGEEPEVTSQRIGEVPGTHTAVFVSGVDRLTLTHEAFSRQGFAEGAVAAAVMTGSLAPGCYEFKDLIL